MAGALPPQCFNIGGTANELFRYYGVVTGADRRGVKVWDVVGDEAKALKDRVLGHTFTCLALGTRKAKIAQCPLLRFKMKPQAKTKAAVEMVDYVTFLIQRDNKGMQDTFVAMGTETGAILVWNLRKGKVVYTLEESKGGSSEITDVIFAHNSSMLVSGHKDGRVREWDLSTGMLKKSFTTGENSSGGQSPSVSKLAVYQNKLLAGFTQICLHDLASGKVIGKFQGHSSSIRCLDFNANGELFASGADDDRFLSIWSTSNLGSKTGKSSAIVREPLYLISLGSAPVSLRFTPSSNPPTYLSCVTTGGSALIYALPAPKNKRTKGKKGSSSSTKVTRIKKPSCRIHVRKAGDAPTKSGGGGSLGSRRKRSVTKSYDTATSREDGPIVSMEWVSSSVVVVARESAIKPGFETKELLADSGEILPQIELEPYSVQIATSSSSSSSAPSAKGKKKQKTSDSAVQAATVGGPTSNIASSSAKLSGSLSRKGTTKEQRKFEEVHISMENRLRALLNPGGAANGDRKASAKRKQSQQQPAASATAAPVSGSLKAVLEQGLVSNDKSLLEYCFENRDSESIRNTVRKIDAKYVLPLLKALGTRFQTRPQRKHLVKWIKHTLQSHTGYLLTVPNLVSQLQAITSNFEKRLEMFPKLLQLYGRLEVLMGMEIASNKLESGEGAEEGVVRMRETRGGGVEVMEQEEEEDEEDDEEEEEDDEEEKKKAGTMSEDDDHDDEEDEEDDDEEESDDEEEADTKESDEGEDEDDEEEDDDDEDEADSEEEDEGNGEDDEDDD
eukprot:jgi/Bigna1/73167/fgenesh1_pg.23_\